MSNFSITKEFSKAWQYRCDTKTASKERRQLKQTANRKARRAFRQSGKLIKPTTGSDVI